MTVLYMLRTFTTLSWILLKGETFSTKVVQNIRTHILHQGPFFWKSCCFMRQCGKILHSQKGHKWKYNIGREHWMLDKWGYTCTLKICITYCFSTTMAKQTHLHLLTPNGPYSGRTAPLTSEVAFYIFIQQT
jgi:hypothetical protein